MIDLAMPEDEDEIDMAALSAGALTKIADIMVIFEKVARLDKRMKDTKAKLDEKKLSQRAIANIHKNIDRWQWIWRPSCGRSTSRRRRAIA